MTPPRSLVSVVLLGLTLWLAPAGTLAQDASPTATPLPSPAPLRPLALEPLDLPPLEGTTWRLTNYRRGELRSVGSETAAWLTLRSGRVRGSTGCVRLAGRYGHVGLALVIRSVPAGSGACSRQASRVATSMVEALDEAARFEIVRPDGEAGVRLVIQNADGREDLRFEPDDAADLAAGDWNLQSYTVAGQTVAADPLFPAVLAFRTARSRETQRLSSGDVLGSSGCNGVVGRFQRQADVLRLVSLERTEAPCSSTVAAQEAAIMAILASPSLTLDLPLDRLILVATDSGDRLEFVASTPLEGTTWLLAAIPGSRGSEGTVTLRMDERQACRRGTLRPLGWSLRRRGRVHHPGRHQRSRRDRLHAQGRAAGVAGRPSCGGHGRARGPGPATSRCSRPAAGDLLPCWRALRGPSRGACHALMERHPRRLSVGVDPGGPWPCAGAAAERRDDGTRGGSAARWRRTSSSHSPAEMWATRAVLASN